MRGFSGTGSRSNPTTCPLAGSSGRGRLGALGFEVNLIKLGDAPAYQPRDPLAFYDDYGIAARRALAEQQRQERINRSIDQQDAAMRAAERERALEIAQKAVSDARQTQVQILKAGSKNLDKVLWSTGVVGVLALAAFSVTQILAKSKERRHHKSSRRGSKRRWSKKRRRSGSMKSANLFEVSA